MTDWRKKAAEDYLRDVQKYARKLEELKQAIRSLHDGQRAIRYDSDNIMASKQIDGVEKSVIALLDNEVSLLMLQIETTQKQAEANNIIMRIDERKHRELLRLYYVEAIGSLDKVAEQMNYTPEYVRALHGPALQLFGEQMDEEQLGDISAC